MVISLFFFFLLPKFFKFSHARELLHTKDRQDDVSDNLKKVIGEDMISCDIEMVGPEIMFCSQAASFLPSAISEDIFQTEMPTNQPNELLTSKSISVKMDNTLSPAHTLVQISCQDHKGLLYDIMRTLKDYNIQVWSFQTIQLHSRMSEFQSPRRAFGAFSTGSCFFMVFSEKVSIFMIWWRKSTHLSRSYVKCTSSLEFSWFSSLFMLVWRQIWRQNEWTMNYRKEKWLECQDYQVPIEPDGFTVFIFARGSHTCAHLKMGIFYL